MKNKIYNAIRLCLCLVAVCGMASCEDKETIVKSGIYSMKVGEELTLSMPSSTQYGITANGSAVEYLCSGNRLKVTAIKEGQTDLTVVTDRADESCNYTFRVAKNAYQIGFTVISRPRVEAWKGETLSTADTPGLQVTYERGIDVAGGSASSDVRTYGFIFPATGEFLRLSARGDFSCKGTLSDGIAALRTSADAPIEYFACEAVSVEKVNDEGKIWMIFSFANRADIRVVTEPF